MEIFDISKVSLTVARDRKTKAAVVLYAGFDINEALKACAEADPKKFDQAVAYRKPPTFKRRSVIELPTSAPSAPEVPPAPPESSPAPTPENPPAPQAQAKPVIVPKAPAPPRPPRPVATPKPVKPAAPKKADA